MGFRQEMDRLLRETGSGRGITPSAYDTAWVARLADLNEPVGEQALDWLREQQLPDGSWGAPEPLYRHERLACTLAAMTALARRGEARDRARLDRARSALEILPTELTLDPAGETVGFEMIMPTLMAEAESLGLIKHQNDGPLARLARYRAAKLAALPTGMINRYVTVAFSAEMVGLDGLALLDVGKLQEENGSVACSPAATAFFALHVQQQNPAALAYLREYAVDGALPYVVPIDVFECAWPLWNLHLAGLCGEEWMALSKQHLDLLSQAWIRGKGIASVATLAFTDGDATGMTYEVLKLFGRSPDLEGVLFYEEDNLFRCYALEANPSISTNIHVLGALRQTGLRAQDGPVRKVLSFLRRTRTLQMFWFDKWHASPFYPTAHAVIHCAGLDDGLVDDAVYWILSTQNSDGSWGYYMPTAEETAYCLQALIIWRRHGYLVPYAVIKQAATWLADHWEGPYPPLWIGKALYCPTLVVRSAILSALILAENA